MPSRGESEVAEVDDVLRRLLEQRAVRSGPAQAHVVELEPVGARAGAGAARATRRGGALLAACTVLVLVALLALLVRARLGGEAGVAGEGAVPPAPFAPDLSELPPPRYYGAMSASPFGTGSLLVPGGSATRDAPDAVGPASTFVQEWRYDTGRNDPGAIDQKRRMLRTRMSWSIPAQGGYDAASDLERTFAAPHGLTARSVTEEADGILFQVATNDPEVTDGQLQALVQRMVAQYHRARGTEPPPPPDDPSVRLTPLPEDLPVMPPTAELEAAFSATGAADRDWYWSPFEPEGPLGCALVDSDRDAFPVFDLDGGLLGIYVAGLGIVPRDEYEAPGFDPETASSDRF